MSIEGQSITVRCKGTLRVNGVITADLHSNELVVGEQAIISGSIAADTVRVFGQVHGAILGANVTLHPSAQVDGDIHAQSLTIEQGASFDGRCRKVANVAEVAPQLDAQQTQHRAYG
jgi:cytoskeletal protein CcmA (bactofilin family)